jgi:hypothetical protein
MATKKKRSKGRATVAKKKATPAAKTREAARKSAAPKRPAPKKAATAAKKPRAMPKKANAGKKAAAVKKPGGPKKAAAKSTRPGASAAKKRTASAPAAVAKVTPIHRRDGTGHLDPQYAAMLREKSLEGRVRDGDEAFIGRSGRSTDNLAEALGETWVETATSGEDDQENAFNQSVPEDEGGPFVTTTAGQEFAEGIDASNPKRSKREPFPKT